MSWTFSNTCYAVAVAIGRSDWGVRLLSLLSSLLTRGGRKMELTVIAPQLVWEDIFSIYYCQPLILAEAQQTSATNSCPKLIRFCYWFEISWCIWKKYLLIWAQAKRELNYVFLTHPILLSLRNYLNCISHCWCLRYFEPSRKLENSSRVTL